MKNQNWNTSLYNEKHAFVYKYGHQIVELLNPQPGEKILDLGCGSGQLTAEIAKSGAEVMGMDQSEEMVNTSRNMYPGLPFEVMDATNFTLKKSVDAVFSNAVLHWIEDKQSVMNCIHACLKNGGRFVAEFGGIHCVENIRKAISSALNEFGFENNSKHTIWHFPSIGEFSKVLEKTGFLIKTIWHIDRLTELEDSESGMKDWIHMFCDNFFIGIGQEVKEKVIERAVEQLYPTNFINGKWYADYTRLRVVAIKN